MREVLWLLLVQGMLGAFDTIYYHELKAKLPALGSRAAAELRLHAARDFIYAAIFGSLPYVAWHGYMAILLAVLLGAEIAITLRDFVVEDSVRRPLGGVYPGERVTHAIMGIVYGAMLANLVPVVWTWGQESTALSPNAPDVPEELRWAMVFLAFGLVVSGTRDLLASCDLPYSHWPWRR